MGRRMSHLYLRGRVWYFRHDVPQDIQPLVGRKTSWQHSLKTGDYALATVKAAAHLEHYKREVLRLRRVVVAGIDTKATELVEKAFDRLARSHGSLDKAIEIELDSVALTVRSSWSRDDARQVEREQLGEEISPDWEYGAGPIDLFGGEHGQNLFKVRAGVFENNPATAGLVYQELAAALLERGMFERLGYQVGCIGYESPLVDVMTPLGFDAVARAYLKRLAGHCFTSHPDNLREAISPVLGRPVSASPSAMIAAGASATVQAVVPRSGHTLQDAFQLWKQRKGISPGEHHKTADEFATAIARFERLCGVSDVGAVTKALIKSYRDQVSQLPFRPGKAIASLPPKDQIALAHEQKLPTLSPPTVGKHVTAIRSILGEAVEAGWIDDNPAMGIVVDGARWQGTERDHFSDDDMRLIYTSPLMTDPDACSDTMFWILFLAPFHGSRPGEFCKLKSDEIVRDGGEWLMRIRADRRRRKVSIDDIVTRPRRQKTLSSIRDVPIHWIVAEGGFLAFADHRRRQGSEWLFDDLVPDKYGDRYKYLSRQINDVLRELGITHPDKSFYSTRHSMKREGRRQRIPMENMSQMTGHARGSVGERYGQGTPGDILKEDMDRLEFRSVDWDPVVACALARVRRLSAHQELVA